MKMLVTALIVYAAFAAFAWFVSDRMIFQPPPASYRAGQLPIAMLPTEGGAIATLYLPNPSAAVTVVQASAAVPATGAMTFMIAERCPRKCVR